jgi:erythromycin esterase-like protein
MNIADIAQELSSAKLLGVGESSHGTHEFFEFKSQLFQALVMEHDFNTLLFEDSPATCEVINDFISSGKGDLDELMKQLYSVWQVEEFKQLLLWLRKNNKQHEVRFVGFDINQTKDSIQKRDELMAKNIQNYVTNNPGTRGLAWAHNSHIQMTGSDFNQKPMGLFLKEHFGDNYAAVGLLFGKGDVSATRLKADAPSSSDRTLSVIAVSTIPSTLVESTLHKLHNKPFYLTKEQAETIGIENLKQIRSIGWGLVPELVNEVVEQTNIKEAFDGLVYFPEARHSHPLPQRRHSS